MALIDHFDPNAGTGAGQNGFDGLPVHEFSGSLALFAAPSPVAVSKSTIMDFWDLTASPAVGADELQLDEMIANYAALATLAEQNQYVITIEKTLGFYQRGDINQNTAKTWLGIT